MTRCKVILLVCGFISTVLLFDQFFVNFGRISHPHCTCPSFNAISYLASDKKFKKKNVDVLSGCSGQHSN